MTRELSNRPARGEPVDIIDAMRREMDRMFSRFDGGFASALPAALTGGRLSPSIDVRDEGDKVAVDVELPGLTEKDVDVTLSRGLLTVKGEKKSEREEKKDDYYVSERTFGSFQRQVRLPDGIDEEKIEARLENGVLRLVMPKKAEAVHSERRIEIGRG